MAGHRKAGREAPGDYDGSSAVFPAFLRRLEQRLTAERRHADLEFQRLERRIEEVACTALAGGRWAELQGHVDGLAETVDGLVKRADERSSLRMHELVASKGPRSTFEVAELATRLSAMEEKQARLEGPLGPMKDLKCQATMASEQMAEMSQQVLHLTSRLREAERHIASLSGLMELPQEVASLALMVQQLCHPGVSQAVHHASTSFSHEAELLHQTNRSSADDWAERLAEHVGSIGVRLERAERALDGHGSRSPNSLKHVARNLGDSYELMGGSMDATLDKPPRLNQQAPATSQRVQVSDEDLTTLHVQIGETSEELAELRGEVEDHVVQLSSRVEEVEIGLEHLRETLEASQSVSRVGEQALRLALRTSQASGVAGQEIKAELEGFTNNLEEFSLRVTSLEEGLEGMAEAFDFVCEELRKRKAAADSAPAGKEPPEDSHSREQDSPQDKEEAKEPVSGEGEEPPAGDEEQLGLLTASAPAPLRKKVVELEQSLETIAEVVWDIRSRLQALESREEEEPPAAAPQDFSFR